MLPRFLDEEGKVKSWPRRQRDKLVVLAHLRGKFEPRRIYTEPEINAVLRRWHTYGQPTQLRRELYDRGFLGRTPDGRAYWVEPPASP